MLAGLFMLCEWILPVPITPIEVTFRHRKPADDRAYREVFRCPIRYGQPLNSILFPAEVLDAPVPSANEELATMLDEMAVKYLSFRFSSRFSRTVRDALVGQLPNGEARQRKNDRQLGMTERSEESRVGKKGVGTGR